jgi:fumarate reductase subunit D
MEKKKKKISIKNRIIYMFTSNYGRLAIASFMILFGGILGTDGLLEIESQQDFWNVVMYIGALVLVVYLIFGLFYAVKNLIKDISGK